MFAKNLLPSHSHLLAHSTIQAISTNSTVAGIIFSQLTVFCKASRRSSFTFTIQVFGSIVQNGKFWASAA